MSNQHPTPLAAFKHAKHSPPQDLSPGCTPKELALPTPLLWPFYHHLSGLGAGHICGWLQTHAAQKTGWGTSGPATHAHQLPAEAGSRGFHKHPTHSGMGCRAALPWAPESLLTSLSPPAGPRARSPTHLGLLLEPLCPPPPPSSSRRSRHAACRHGAVPSPPAAAAPAGRAVTGPAAASGWLHTAAVKKAQRLWVTAQSYRVTTRHRTRLYLVGHPQREGRVQQSPRFLKSPFI